MAFYHIPAPCHMDFNRPWSCCKSLSVYLFNGLHAESADACNADCILEHHWENLKVVSGEKEEGSKVSSIDGYFCGTVALEVKKNSGLCRLLLFH